MNHCKTEQEVIAWAKINGYALDAVPGLISKWKEDNTLSAKISKKIESTTTDAISET
jgi:hypothetical protein